MKLQRGFSLIELAIVLVIVTLLIGGLAVPLSAQIQARRIAETQKTLAEANQAIIGYAMTHPATPPNSRFLPCPDTDGDGKEDRAAGACSSISGTVSSGYLPWVDLGVASQDAWGNRLRYAVVATLADENTGFSIASTTPAGPLVFCGASTCSAAAPDVANNLATVVVSHGPNGRGALNVNNSPGNLNAAPSGADELANLDTDRIYISRSPTPAGTASGEFDDLPVSTSFSQLVARVCPTGCP
ncbi:MAG: type II secretion system protein [Thiobacillus sp.]|nr:type II secretion system protein [Thiobacillus sp.]